MHVARGAGGKAPHRSLTHGKSLSFQGLPLCTVRFIGQCFCYSKDRKKKQKEVGIMRGYFTANGFYGLVDGRYRLFASESEYYEQMGDDAA